MGYREKSPSKTIQECCWRMVLSVGEAREKQRFISEKTDGIFFVKLYKIVGIFLIGYI